jgi:hypothetical protein
LPVSTVAMVAPEMPYHTLNWSITVKA